MKARELIKILEEHPDAEVFYERRETVKYSEVTMDIDVTREPLWVRYEDVFLLDDGFHKDWT